MKKTRLITAFVLISILAILALVGCKKEDKVASVSLKDHDPSTAVEIAVGGFDFSAYTVLVTYESGATEELALTEELIAAEDLLKLYQVGDHDIAVCYGEQRYTFKVSVKRASFGELSFPEDLVLTYDGKEHTVEVDGEIPANALVTYPGGNTFVNAGTYDVVAIVSCDGYVTERLSTTVRIERARHDMSGVSFEDKEIVYDGGAHSIAISGALPEGVSAPTYTVNGAAASGITNVGEYRFKASFANTDPNYEAIPDMEATLRIIPAEYTVSGVDIVFKTIEGDIISEATKIFDGKGVRFDIDDYGKLSRKLTVSFSVSDSEGNVISTSKDDTNIVAVGVYTVKAEFTLAGGENYNPIAPIVRTFEVLRSEHPELGSIYFGSAQTTYDGEEHSILIDGRLPEGVTVSYEYYFDGALVVGADGMPAQSVRDAGRYTVKAVFSHTDENRAPIPSMSATLNVEKQKISTFLIGLSYASTPEYSGAPHKAEPITWKTVNGTDYDILEYGAIRYYVLDSATGAYVEMESGKLPTDVGSYRIAMIMTVSDSYNRNYCFNDGGRTMTVTGSMEIRRKSIAVPEVVFDGDPRPTYSGTAPVIEFSHTADPALVSTSTAYMKAVSGEYVAMADGELPINKGFYRLVVTVSIRDAARYVFDSEQTSAQYLFDFEILPMTIDVSGIALSATELTYNGEDQSPRLVNLPAHVTASMRFYPKASASPIDSVINAGEYRCEVDLSPESPNYVLSPTYRTALYFDILPIQINVDGLAFDTLSFDYDGNPHAPSLTVPDHVEVNDNLYWLDPMLGESYVDEAVRAGKYRCEAWLTAENTNYVLSGQTRYSAEFEIIALYTQIADIGALAAKLESTDFYIELPYDDKYANGYYYAEDDEVIAAAICNAIFLENADYAQCRIGGILKDVETGKFLREPNSTEMVRGKVYEVSCQLSVKDEFRDSYSMLYHGGNAHQIVLTLRFKFI